MERRRVTRIPFAAVTKIVHGLKTYEGEIDNLSIGGVFIKTNENIALESQVSIILYLGSRRIEPIDIKGIVKRNEHRGVAVKFDDYTELNNKLINYYL